MTKNMQFCHFCVTLILIWLLVLNFPNTNAARGNPSKLLPPPRTSHNSPSALTQTPPSGPGKIAVQGHPSPSAHSAVGQNPPSGSRQDYLSYSYKSLKNPSFGPCNETRTGSCLNDLGPPEKRCNFHDRSCSRP
nr:hypothetical protein Iba_scaffold91958CG0010 [Ipomoea batatas]GMD62997.1 hypothetical protein Iba_scaffold49078CG0010 [Ipomoea batatas]GMD80420.1 hypothetical protein Iba_chr13eCG1690 [Ipomoea batatas]GME12953.1 hypothetical protein Iba_scaffold14287CG0020 [Ipomoea batatas]GME12954.1 hypothetical protein Iba_scaffold14287CG0030 [Ipomoea batatas]